jgi:membrane protease YdiL (CAAX protease family)
MAAVLGACCGLLLFALLARAFPRLPACDRWPVFAGKLAILALLAANEEVLWRRVALGELLRAGVVPALAASTLGFALLHRARPALHLGTGGVFGALYVSTGTLAACVAAHWTYNVLVAALVERSRG